MSDNGDLIQSFSETLKVSSTLTTPNNDGLNMLKIFVDTISNYHGDINLLNNFQNACHFNFDNYGNTTDTSIKTYFIRVVNLIVSLW